MKILHVLPEFPARPRRCPSGVINVVYHLSKEQVKLGHEVTVSTSSAGCTKNRGKEQIGDDSSPFNGVNVLHFSSFLSYDHFYVTPKFVSFMKKSLTTFDVVHIHDVRCFQSIVAQYYARRYNRPYVLQTHGSHLGVLSEKKLKWMLDCASSRRILRNATRAIALNTTEAEYYSQLGLPAHIIDVVGNGIDVAEYEGGHRGEFRKKFGIGKEDRVILYVGRLTNTKGLDLLVETISDLKKSLRALKLVIVGPDDGYESELKRQVRALKIEACTLFTGPVDETDKKDAYIDADVFVTPSFTGFPLTFLESCACGTPIVTTKNADTLDWIDGKVGYVTAYKKNELAQAIMNIICEETIRAEFTANCRTLVEKQFAWPKIVDKIQETYCRAAKS